MVLLREDTVPCAVRLGATSPMLVELFERVTLQPFTDTPGSNLTSRIRSMGRILRDVLATSGSSFSPPLGTSKTTCRTGDYTTLNRFPRQPCHDISSWRRRVCQAEQYQTPQLRPAKSLPIRTLTSTSGFEATNTLFQRTPSLNGSPAQRYFFYGRWIMAKAGPLRHRSALVPWPASPRNCSNKWDRTMS